MKITYEISLLNSSRRVVEERKGKAKSLLENYYLAFYRCLSESSVSLTDTSGASFTPPLTYYKCFSGDFVRKFGELKAPEGDSNYGILIGTSDVSPSPSDADLYQKFSCHPLSTIVSDVYLEGSNPAFHVIREFENDVEEVAIKEFGLVAKIIKDVSAGDYRYVLLLRDVVTPIAFPLDYSLRVKIKFSF